MLSAEWDHDGWVLRALALVDRRRTGQHQFIQLAKAVGDFAAVEIDAELAFLHVDAEHDAEIAVVNLLVIIVFDLHDLVARAECPAEALDADIAWRVQRVLRSILSERRFDGVTGAYDRIDIRGENGLRLKDTWAEIPRTYLGMLAEGFPNMLMVLGPHTARGNITQAISHSVEFQAGMLRFMQQHNYTHVETRPQKVDEWTRIVIKAGEACCPSRSIRGRMASIVTSMAGLCAAFWATMGTAPTSGGRPMRLQKAVTRNSRFGKPPRFVARPFCELSPARTDQVLGVIGRHFDGAVRADVDVPAREGLHGPHGIGTGRAGSHVTQHWRGVDSNFQFRARGAIAI
jgi:hypothetical protein